jgi:hypothetical protein
VTDARRRGFNAKEECDHQSYDGFVMRFSEAVVAELNMMGGIRIFSFGDYMPELDDDIEGCLDDCWRKGLSAKAITKQPSFIERFHYHPALRVINISVDNLAGDIGRSPITHTHAQKLREKWPKVLVRCVALTQDDLEFFGGCPWIDVITLNHVNRRPYHHFSREEVAKAEKLYPGRVCCETGKCSTCSVRCGAMPDGSLYKLGGT